MSQLIPLRVAALLRIDLNFSRSCAYGFSDDMPAWSYISQCALAVSCLSGRGSVRRVAAAAAKRWIDFALRDGPAALSDGATSHLPNLLLK
jgi:hypothetical protein